MNKCVLLIDDDPDELEILREALSDLHLPIVCVQATTLNSAVKMLNNLMPEYIFIDVNIPGTNGLVCLEEVKKIKSLCDIPVFLYSTHISMDTFNKAMDAGAAGCIKKTDTVGKLSETLREVFLSNDQRKTILFQ